MRDITSASSERTAIGAILPDVGVGGTLMLVGSQDANAVEEASVLGVVNSFVFDYCARQKVVGTHLNPSIFKQLPLPTSQEWGRLTDLIGTSGRDWVATRVLELTYTAWDVEPFALAYGCDRSPFAWDEVRRMRIQCELDAAMFHLYLPSDARGHWARSTGPHESRSELTAPFPTPRDAASYILDTFPIARAKDERRFGSFKRKDMILELYDAIQAASVDASSYASLLPSITLE